MYGYENYCDHEWQRDDISTKQCWKCGKYKDARK